MAYQIKDRDILVARHICAELRSGNADAIIELYNRYHIYFTALTRRRLFCTSQGHIENILSDYWLELLNARAICSYRGKASLRSYLTGILYRRIIDANRRTKRERGHEDNRYDGEIRVSATSRIQPSPENDVLAKEQKRLVHGALLQLAHVSPRDAKLIHMHFENLSYEEMARRELQGRDTDPIQLNKKTVAIKKQFTREKTGSMAKFKRILKRCLEKHSLTTTDLFN